MKESITVEDVLDVLNRAVEKDPGAMSALVEQRIPCNRALADDPTIQVAAKDDDFKVGFLGVLNGCFGVDDDGWGPIMMRLEDGKVLGFVRTTEEAKGRVPDRLGYQPKEVTP